MSNDKASATYHPAEPEPCALTWQDPDGRGCVVSASSMWHGCTLPVHYSTPHLCACGATR